MEIEREKLKNNGQKKKSEQLKKYCLPLKTKHVLYEVDKTYLHI